MAGARAWPGLRAHSQLIKLAPELARGLACAHGLVPDPACVGTRAWSGLRARTRPCSNLRPNLRVARLCSQGLALIQLASVLAHGPACAHGPALISLLLIHLAQRSHVVRVARIDSRAGHACAYRFAHHPACPTDSPLIHHARSCFTARAGGRSLLIQLARMNPRHPMHPANPHQHSSLSAQRSTLSDAAARARARQRPAHRPPARRPLGRHGRRPASAPAASRRDRRRPRPARP